MVLGGIMADSKGGQMKIAVITDVHSDVGKLAVVGGELAEADVIVICGDITQFGNYDEMARVIRELRVYNPNILAVPGNCDTLDAGRYLVEEGISLDGRCVVFGGVAFVGVGGSLPIPGHMPHEMHELDFSQRLEQAAADRNGEKLVLVTHQPPYGTFADRACGEHVGSRAIAGFIEKYKPRYCFCGHIHDAAGRGMLGETEIVNPGPFRHSKSAVIVDIDV